MSKKVLLIHTELRGLLFAILNLHEIFFLRWHYPVQVQGSELNCSFSAKNIGSPDFICSCLQIILHILFIFVKPTIFIILSVSYNKIRNISPLPVNLHNMFLNNKNILTHNHLSFHLYKV